MKKLQLYVNFSNNCNLAPQAQLLHCAVPARAQKTKTTTMHKKYNNQPNWIQYIRNRKNSQQPNQQSIKKI